MNYSISYVNFDVKLIKRVVFYLPNDDSFTEIEILFYESPDGEFYVDQLCDNLLIYDHDPIDDFEDALSLYHHLCDRFILQTR